MPSQFTGLSHCLLDPVRLESTEKIEMEEFFGEIQPVWAAPSIQKSSIEF